MKSYQLINENEALQIAEELKESEWQHFEKKVTDKDTYELLRHEKIDYLHNRLTECQQMVDDFFVQAIMPPKFVKYEAGQGYGPHCDAAFLGPSVGLPPLRTDLACTIFLTDEYEGGELCMSGVGYKGAAGTCVIYPCWKVHEVNRIMEGTRLVAVTWMQSMIRDEQDRYLLRTLKSLMDGSSGESVVVLSSVYNTLLKRWAA
jgi:predicted 2-oxoglutarate/Fe(II)-dependent dioxygenase YbiX